MIEEKLLLAHTEFLRRLALSLVRDAARADDLVQDTWVAALRRPPADRSTARAWLARVLRNRAISNDRSERRRKERERCAAELRAARPSPETIAEREAVGRKLVDAVFGLSEPYRSTILQRYYEGLTPGEISELHDLPAETVKTRLKRGRALLRRELEREFAGSDRSWSAAVAATFGLERAVEPAAAQGATAGSAAAAATSTAPAAAASSTTITLLTGGAIMSTKLSVVSLSAAALLAVASGVLYHQWSSASDANAALEAQLSRDVAALTTERDRLAEEIRRSEELRRGLSGEVTAARAAEAEARALAAAGETTEATAEDEGATASARRSTGEPYLLASLSEADRLATDLLAKNDVERLWLLAADLMAEGEPGYQKLVELWASLDVDTKMRELFQGLWDDDMLGGPFLRMVAERRDEILRFGLWLSEQDTSKLPEALAGIGKELLTDEMGVALLGAYDGNDPEILGGWLEHYKRLLAGDIAKVHEAENYIHAISQLRTPEAGAALLEVAVRAPPNRMEDVVRALAWHGSADALPFLRSLEEQTTDPKLRAIIAQAIRFLE